MACGIYSITRKSTGQIYIGKSIHIFRRFYEHCQYPNPTSRIDNAIKKHGKEDFELKILKCCKPKYLTRFEKLYIRIYDTFNNNFHYNLTVGGEGFGYGKDNPSFKNYPTIQKGGFDNTKQIYHLVYHGKRMRSTHDKKKLQGYIDKGTWKKFYSKTDKEFLRKDKEKSKLYGEKHPLYRNDIIIDEILELLENGFTTNDIASEKNISASTLRNRLIREIDEEIYNEIKKRNIEKLKKFNVENNAWIELDDEKLYDEYQNELLSLNEIGKRYGTTGSTVKTHIKHYAEENNLPFDERNSNFYKFKDYPRIIKRGKDYEGNQRYVLIYKSKPIKESRYYNKLEKYLDNPKLLEELYEKYTYRNKNRVKILHQILERNEYIEKNNIKYFRVGKIRNPKSRTGFYWTYTFTENKIRKTISSIDIKELEKKVIEKGWVWKELKEEEKAKKQKISRTREEISLEISKTKTTTGIYRVKQLNRADVNNGILWEYSFKKDNKLINLSSIDLENLKEKVLIKNLPWIILDKSKATKSFELNKSFNNETKNIRKHYTLWDSSKIKYRKSKFKKNNGLNPMGCFNLKFNNKQINCGTFIEFLTPTIIYDFIKENE